MHVRFNGKPRVGWLYLVIFLARRAPSIKEGVPVLRVITPVGPVSSTFASFIGPLTFQAQAKRALAIGDTSTAQRAFAAARHADSINLAKLAASVAPKSAGILQLARGFSINPFPRVAGEAAPQTALWRVYDAKNREPSDAEVDRMTPVVQKGDNVEEKTSDPTLRILAHAMQATLDLFLEFGINSLDNRGMGVQGAAHVGVNLVNAYYAGTDTFYTGDGDKRDHVGHFAYRNVVGHELGHGIVELFLGGLRYYGLTGALNEHIADLFGIFVDRLVDKHLPSSQMSRRIGDESMDDNINGDGQIYSLRWARFPGKAHVNHPAFGTDRQPATMDKLYTGGGDNGGVHINSGIPNFALSLALDAYGDDWASDLRLGKAWVMAVKKLKTRMDAGEVAPSNVFQEFARATMETAQEMFPGDQKMVDAMKLGWETARVIGPNKVEVPMDTFEIQDDEMGAEVARLLNLDEVKLARLRKQLEKTLPSSITSIPGLTSVKAGFQLKADGSAEVVLVAFVDEVKPGLTAPAKFKGFKVVVRKDPEPAEEPLAGDPAEGLGGIAVARKDGAGDSDAGRGDEGKS